MGKNISKGFDAVGNQINAVLRKLHGLSMKVLHQRREKLRLTVSDSEVGLFANDREVWRFPWNKVTRIETYKRDLFSVDLICLDFFVESLQLTYRTNEEMQGFQKLIKCLHNLFPSIDENWHRQVTFSAFATNHKVLYST